MSMPVDNSSANSSTDAIIDATASTDEEFVSIVVTAIAEETGVDPAALPPLGDSIDPDLLNAVRDATGKSNCALLFRYYGYEVVVTNDGRIKLQSGV